MPLRAYAHYEGYSLSLFTLYLNELEQMGIVRGEVQEKLMEFSLGQHLPRVRSRPVEELIEFIRSGFAALLAQSIDFPRDKKQRSEFDLKGRSNLWPKELASCSASFCIAPSTLDATDVRLRLLVGRRNAIAHGRDTPVRDHDEYLAYEGHTLNVMSELASAVETALLQCSYLRPDVKLRETERLAYLIAQTSGRDELANWFEAEKRLSEGQRA